MLRLVSRGLSSKEVAARLVISPKTARNHIEHIYGEDRGLEPGGGQPVRDAARLDP